MGVLLYKKNTISKVNREARKSRHKKLFGTHKVLAKRAYHFVVNGLSRFSRGKLFSLSTFFKTHTRLQSERLMHASNLQPVTLPTTRIFRRTIVLCVCFLVLSAIIPSKGEFDTGYALNFTEGTYNDFVEYKDLVVDEDGFFTKGVPQSGEYDRSELTDKFVHIVKEGENLSIIAQNYGLQKVSTLIWENNLDASGRIKPGQKLIIPPTDGVTHKVKKNETIESIAKKYDIEVDDILRQNGLSQDDTLKVDQEIFIPHGKLIIPPPTKTTVSSGGSTKKVNYVPQGNKPFIFPTSGKLTQGYHAGHYAHDIGNQSRPHIWAAGAGKVVKVSTGGWGGGYGNHVIIDHGNGVQTLYAHMDSVYVTQGQQVDQGQVVGRMGNTGRVYGPTGIHLHFEVRVNGVKKNPWLYY